MKRRQFETGDVTPTAHRVIADRVIEASLRALDRNECPEDGRELIDGRCECGFRFSIIPPHYVAAAREEFFRIWRPKAGGSPKGGS